MPKIVLYLILTMGCLAGPPDKYPNFKILAQSEIEGRDFVIRTENRNSKIISLAIHGGTIEPFTEKLAEDFAGSDFNLYLFEALKPNGWDLHLTSTHFDEPRALKLVQESDVCISFHGENDQSNEKVCIGGTHKDMAEKMALSLKNNLPDIKIETPCKRLPGIQKTNIGNRCKMGGVQLEISVKLLDALSKNSDRAKQFIKALRAPIASSIKNKPLSLEPHTPSMTTH